MRFLPICAAKILVTFVVCVCLSLNIIFLNLCFSHGAPSLQLPVSAQALDCSSRPSLTPPARPDLFGLLHAHSFFSLSCRQFTFAGSSALLDLFTAMADTGTPPVIPKEFQQYKYVYCLFFRRFSLHILLRTMAFEAGNALIAPVRHVDITFHSYRIYCVCPLCNHPNLHFSQLVH